MQHPTLEGLWINAQMIIGSKQEVKHEHNRALFVMEFF
jgi:hypothetical protein